MLLLETAEFMLEHSCIRGKHSNQQITKSTNKKKLYLCIFKKKCFIFINLLSDEEIIL